MIDKLSFKKKIFLFDFIIHLVFITAFFPLIGLTIDHIVRKNLLHRTDRLINLLQDASNQEEMVEIVQTWPQFLTKQVVLLNNQGTILAVSFRPVDVHPQIGENLEIGSPEVIKALKEGKGFSERFALYFHEEFLFFAETFQAQGNTYIIQTSSSLEKVDQLKSFFKIGYLVISLFLLGVSSFIDALIIYYITRPVKKIIDCIAPFQQGKEALPKHIPLDKTMQGSDFGPLARTLNSLIDRIQKQIQNLRRQREMTEEILDSLEEGIIATNGSAQVTFVNKAACKMLNLPGEALLDQRLDSIKGPFPELLKKCQDLILYALQTYEPIIHTWILRENNIPRYLDLICSPHAHQNGALLVLQDKTSDYRIVELGKDFIANASHELRTPITIIHGYAEALKDNPKPTQPVLFDMTEKIIRTCGRLEKLVKSLLILSDIENLTLDRQETSDLIAHAENGRYSLLETYPYAQVSFHTDLDQAAIMVDADLLDMAIYHILENAVKYSQKRPEIEMAVIKRDREVCLRIKDHGIGISKEHLPHIFDRFYTVDKALTRKTGGAGLGLSIAKMIVEKHRGRIEVESEKGKGSTFTIVLPERGSDAKF